MKSNVKKFLGAFLITVILVITLIGFALIDISTERYMPGNFTPLFQVEKFNSMGLSITFMGEEYTVFQESQSELENRLGGYRLLLPAIPQWGAMLTEKVYSSLKNNYDEYIETYLQQEE